MRKKSDKELGVVLPESMVDAIGNKQLTDTQIGQLIRAVLWNSMEYGAQDIVVSTLASTLVGTYKGANSARIKKIKASRESKKEYERKRREKANIVEDAILKSVKENMEFHGIVGKVRLGNNNTPIIPLAGDKKSSSAKAEAEAPENEPSERPTTRPATGSPSTGRRTGQTVAKGRDGAGSARPTAQTLHSGDSRERPATSSKKTGGGNSKRTTASGLWDGAAVVLNAAEAMMARHPNAKSGKRAVERAIVAAIADDNDGDRVAPETVDAIDKAHAAWCATDGWAADKGQFVQALAAWIRNGGWRKLPPEKKKTPPPKGDEMSFGASL